MQESVTSSKRKKKQLDGVKSVIFTVLFIFIFFLIFSILVVSKRSNICFEPQTFYLVYVQKDKNQEVLLENKSKVKNLGGAGIIVEKNKVYYLAVSIYQKKDDAVEIKNNIEKQFKESGVVELLSKSISNKYRKLLKQNDCYFIIYKKIYDLIDENESLIFNYVKGEIGDGKFISTLLAEKIELEKLKESCEKQKVVDLEVLLEYISILLSHYENILNKFYTVDLKESLCFEFFINYVQTYIELSNNFN